MDKRIRCWWCGDDSLYQHYHDYEWGKPLHDDQRLFELLCLEGAQAGLSWITILKKRDNYRNAFDQFDAAKMARYSDKKIATLLHNSGIVRNRLKVNGFIQNARAYLRMRDSGITLNQYLWEYVAGMPVQNQWQSHAQVPAVTPLSEQLSKDMKKRGFTFVGATICYAYMQAIGMVNDHTIDCYRYRELGGC